MIGLEGTVIVQTFVDELLDLLDEVVLLEGETLDDFVLFEFLVGLTHN